MWEDIWIKEVSNIERLKKIIKELWLTDFNLLIYSSINIVSSKTINKLCFIK